MVVFYPALLKKTFQLYEAKNFFSTIKGLVTQDRAKIWRDKYICVEDRLSDVLFSDPFPKKRSDREFQKSGFRFDLKNPLEVWIFWIHDPFLDFSNKTRNLFSDSRIRIWTFPKKRTLSRTTKLPLPSTPN